MSNVDRKAFLYVLNQQSIRPSIHLISPACTVGPTSNARLQEVSLTLLWALSRQHLQTEALIPHLPSILQLIAKALQPSEQQEGSTRAQYYGLAALLRLHEQCSPRVTASADLWLQPAWRLLANCARVPQVQSEPSNGAEDGSVHDEAIARIAGPMACPGFC